MRCARSCDDLLGHGVSMLTLGQYLRPSAAHLPVAEFVEPAVFAQLASDALRDGVLGGGERAVRAVELPRSRTRRRGRGTAVRRRIVGGA